jgi:hypothetical protein
MKHIGIISLALAAGFAAPAMALELPDAVSQPSLYFKVGFGGAASAEASRLRYGLRLDRAWQHAAEPAPAVVALEFTGAGFDDVRLGGLPLVATSLRLSQAEEAAGAADSPAWKFWNWGLPQWGLVAGGAIIAAVVVSYDDPAEQDKAPPAEGSSAVVACGDDVPQPVFGSEDCI